MLDKFGLHSVRSSLVEKLSGGQRKRLSIAMEFVSGPTLFILDEPDSGLDGIVARKLFESLRSIADEGKIVIVITHTPDRVIDLFDDVIVLAKDSGRTGRLAFYGSIDESYEFFSIPDILKDVTDMMISKWGTQGLCALARYNDLPAVLIWNRMVAAGNVDLGGIMKLSDVMRIIDRDRR